MTFRRSKIAAALALSVFSGQPLFAQQADESEIEKIIVTGSKMDQGIKEIPASVTILNEQLIEQSGMRSLRDIDEIAPNVSISQIGQVGGTYISIRGIESNPFIVNRTAVYVDGIPYREPDLMRLHDVKQIEILRGPQGTLYGSNADAGVIVISTKTPDQEINGEFGIAHDDFESGNAYTMHGALSGGLTENLTAIVNLELEKGDSYIRNDASSIGLPGEIEHLSASAKFRYFPNQQSQLDVLFFYSELDAPGLYEQEFPALDIALYNQSYAAFNSGKTISDFTQLNDAAKKTTENEWGVSIAFEHDFNNFTLNMNASYRAEDETAYGADFDLTAMPASAGGQDVENRNWNTEIRLADSDAEGIDWLVGVTASKDEKDRVLLSLVGPGGFTDYQQAQVQSVSPKSQAVFGQVIFPLSEQLALTTGLRYERSSVVLAQEDGVLDLGAIGQFTFQQVYQKSTNSELVPKIALNYALNDQTQVYASATKGFMPGGFNLVAAENGPVISEQFGPYQAEELWAYEIGSKTELLDGKAFLSGAIFYIDARAWQEYNALTAPDGRILSTILINSDASIESTGFELEFNYRVSEKLTLMSGLGVTDASYDSYHFSDTVDYSGNKVKLIPEYDVNLAATYQINNNWYVRASAQGLGKTALDPQNDAFRESMWLFDASTGYKTENWSIRLVGKNITNKRYAAGLAYKNFLFGDDGNNYAPIAPPRVVSLELDWYF